MDIRNMRPEKHRRAYVAWIDEQGDISVDVLPVRSWVVVGDLWRPAILYSGRWITEDTWPTFFPLRALVVLRPGEAAPSDAFLVGKARALVKRPVRFIPDPYTDDDRVRQVQAAEDRARGRAYPPPAAPRLFSRSGWWAPRTFDEERAFHQLTEGHFDTDCCVRRGRELGEPTENGNPSRREFLGRSQYGPDRPVRPAEISGSSRSTRSRVRDQKPRSRSQIITKNNTGPSKVNEMSTTLEK